MGAHFSKKRVLVVDGAPAVMESFALLLRAAGFDAVGEVSPARALDAAEAHHPDILLCDIQLGETNGVELSLEIFKLLPACRVILMSGDMTSTEILAEAHERGYDFEVIPKPILPEELLTLLGQPA